MIYRIDPDLALRQGLWIVVGVGLFAVLAVFLPDYRALDGVKYILGLSAIALLVLPALPGLVTEGDTLTEARAMAEDAIRGYLESLRKHGEAIPIEQGEPITERILVSLSGA